MIPFVKAELVDTYGGRRDISGHLLSLQISKGAEATKNTVTIEVTNKNSEFTDVDERKEIKIGDSSLIIWLDWEPITTQEPVISATITSIDFGVDNNGKHKLKIKGTDKTGLLLSKLWSESIQESANWNASDAVINVIDHLNGLEGSDSDDISLAKQPLTTNHVATINSRGLPLKKPISIAKIWKPGYEWLNDLSQPEYTGDDRPYVYWIDQNNDLHWHYPYQKPSTFLTSNIDSFATTIPVMSTLGYPDVGVIVIEDEVISYDGLTSNSFLNCVRGAKMTLPTGHLKGKIVSGLYLYLGKQDIYKLDVGTTEDNTYNFIIYNGGPTPKGYELLEMELDESQIGKKFRMKFFDWKAIGKSLMDYEMSDAGWVDKDSKYPPMPWKPHWLSTTVTTNKEYQDAFVAQIKAIAKARASAYFITGKQKYKATVQLRGTLAYDVNDLVNVVSPRHNKTLMLRVKDVKHQLNKGSWITDLELEADSEALQDTQ